MEVSVSTPMMMKRTLGGMMGPMVQVAAVMAAMYPGS